MNKRPDPTVVYPVLGEDGNDPFDVTYIKPTITRPNIIVGGDFSYYSGSDFESRVTHHYEFYDDKLIIGKFCQIAAGVEFIMNGTNHKMDGASTFPFYIFGWKQDVPPLSVMPCKGDTVVGNDVWIGQNATILPGVRVGDGVIIGANSMVGSDVGPYTIVAGNPAKPVRKRFDNELIALLQAFKWWDKPIDEIQELIPLLHDRDLEKAKKEIKERLSYGSY
ncbi:MAG: CatB-related O-acetyltransferase [Synergistaceae bacterium]|jgi:virginiamycin A acetyltransferase|nr:CatB-related O-acetyltransferase [Synergistaceae bacterium]